MKFFTTELWRGLFSTDVEKRSFATRKWAERRKQYEQYLQNKVYPSVSQETWETIVRCHDFHDYIISQILFESTTEGNTKRVINIKLVLDDEIVLVLENVTNFSFEICNQESFPDGSFAWGYCEFELVDNKIKLSILCDVSNLFMFIFDKLTLQESSKQTWIRRFFCKLFTIH